MIEALIREGSIRDGQLIRPRMGADGGYFAERCDCGLVHRLDFSITPENGLELLVYRDEEKTFSARRDAALERILNHDHSSNRIASQRRW